MQQETFFTHGTISRPFLAGGVASCVAEAATYPIDTAKTRLQLQGQAIERRVLHAPYRGMLDVWTRVASEEGARALYRGLSPALLRQAVYGTIKFGLYRTAKDFFNGQHEESVARNACYAAAAGSVASAAATPADVLKVRLQRGQQEPLSQAPLVAGRNLREAAADVWQREGVRGLWRGCWPTAQRAAVVAGVQLPVYDKAKTVLLRWLTDGPANHLASSVAAGLAAAAASCPVDVVRTRLMGQRRLKQLDQHQVGGGQHAFYRGSLHCLTATLRTEGFSALYKGFVPSFVRMGPWNVIFFLVYEQLMRLRR